MSDKPMTVKDWEWLMAFAGREGRAARRAGLDDSYYKELEAKCKLRADALHDGRVVP